MKQSGAIGKTIVLHMLSSHSACTHGHMHIWGTDLGRPVRRPTRSSNNGSMWWQKEVYSHTELTTAYTSLLV